MTNQRSRKEDGFIFPPFTSHPGDHAFILQSMAIWRFRISFYKVILGSCLVLLIVLFAGEIFYSFSDEELHFDDAAARVDVIKLKDDSDEPGKEYDFLEVDENWTEGYSEGVLALDITNC